MQIFASITLAVMALLASNASGAIIDTRAADCAALGSFEPFTGPCKATNCGAKGRDCKAEGFDGCVGFPNVQCPLKGCSCTDF